jgi:hypothetical protein
MHRRIRTPLAGFLGLLALLVADSAAVLAPLWAAPAPEANNPGWQEPAPPMPDIVGLPPGTTARLGRAAQPLNPHAFSPDGKLLAASDWKHIYLWDVRTGKRRGGR